MLSSVESLFHSWCSASVEGSDTVVGILHFYPSLFGLIWITKLLVCVHYRGILVHFVLPCGTM